MEGNFKEAITVVGLLVLPKRRLRGVAMPWYARSSHVLEAAGSWKVMSEDVKMGAFETLVFV
jgi:hypothetical protein